MAVVSTAADAWAHWREFDDITEQLTKLKARAAERPDVTEKLEAFVQTLTPFGPPHPRPGAPPSLFVLESVRDCSTKSKAQMLRRPPRSKRPLRMLRQKLGR